MVHDLGMAAGEFDDKGNPVNPAVNSYLEIVDGKPVLKSKVITQSTEDLADTIRGNHTLNSALAVLNNRALFESIGVDPDLVALLCRRYIGRQNRLIFTFGFTVNLIFCELPDCPGM